MYTNGQKGNHPMQNEAITDRVSSRVFRVAALPAPSDREKTEIYLQRYMQYFPAAGEIVTFDRRCAPTTSGVRG
jgi:polyphosphate kinase 2 (PPK2 family)